MGAIVAIMGEAGDPALPERLERMLARSPYRGTPERLIEGGFALGVQTRGWDASLASVGNWTVAMHGVVGNWPELAPIYGWDFQKNASSATKLAIAYEDLGDALFGKLRGEFSILILDRRTGRHIAVRDLWAQRPLFFENTPHRTYIASEIRQVRAGSGIANEIDGDMLIRTLLWSTAFPTRTHVRGVQRVQAGRVHVFAPDHRGDLPPGTRIWNPPEPTAGRYDVNELTDELRDLIDRAVKRWLIDIPFAVSLSGGVDSSTVWWTNNKRAQEGDPSAALGRPYSLVRPGHPFDESAQIERVLEATGSTGTLIDISSHHGIEALIRNAEKIDCPCHAAISQSSEFFGRLQADGRQILLSGSGGDGVLGGSIYYFADLVRNRQVFRFLHDLFRHQLTHGQSRRTFIKRRVLAPVWRRIFPIDNGLQISQSRPWIHSSRLSIAKHHDDPQSSITQRPENQHRAQILGNIKWQQSVLSQDGFEQLLAATGIERGAPLSDIDLVNFAMRIPPRAFSDGIRYKQLLRNVAYDKLSEDISGWEGPFPYFSLSERETASLRELHPPDSWKLVDEKIVDVEGLSQIFDTAGTSPRSSADLGNLAVVEEVVRHLICQQ